MCCPCLRRRAGPRISRHHGEPVAGSLLHQDRHELPGRVGIEPVVHIADHLADDGGVDGGELPRKSLCDMFNGVAFGIGNHPCQTDRPDRGPSIQQPVKPNSRPDRRDHAPTPVSSPHRIRNRKTRRVSSHSSVSAWISPCGQLGKTVVAVAVALCTTCEQVVDPIP